VIDDLTRKIIGRGFTKVTPKNKLCCKVVGLFALAMEAKCRALRTARAKGNAKTNKN